MIEACTKAIDSMIVQCEMDLRGEDREREPLCFEAPLVAHFEGTRVQVACSIVLDLAKDTREQLEWYPPAQVAEGVRYLILGAVTA